MPSLSQSRFTGLDQVSRDVNADLHWYALRTNAHHEKRVRDRLTGVGIEPFLPVTTQQRQWSDRKVLTELPLFTGYCFASILAQESFDDPANFWCRRHCGVRWA